MGDSRCQRALDLNVCGARYKAALGHERWCELKVTNACYSNSKRRLAVATMDSA